MSTATFSIPKKVRPKRKVPNDGRPTKQTPELVKKLCDALSMGLNDEEAAAVAGISDVTLTVWRRNREFLAKIKGAVAERLYKRLQRIELGGDGWQGTAWVVERLYPSRFSKPEIQLNLNNNITNNTLSISISSAEVQEIEAIAEPVRESVKAMFAQYKPALGNGNGQPARPVVEVEAAEVREAPIVRKVGDEHNQSFWRTLVSADPETPVALETAIFAIRVLLLQTQGCRAHRTEINFDHDPITTEELFGTLEGLCGGAAGWQLAQKLGGF